MVHLKFKENNLSLVLLDEIDKSFHDYLDYNLNIEIMYGLKIPLLVEMGLLADTKYHE